MKNKLLLRAPVLTASGYGVHARQVLKALLASDSFDVVVDPINWGQTPFVYDDPALLQVVGDLSSKKAEYDRQGVQYDISVQVTIPNEFARLARLNIGITAGIEVDRVSPEWIKKANENIDLVIVPSQHSAVTFANVQYRGQRGEMLRLEKPLIVCPEGVDTAVFKVAESQLSRFDTSFNFLCVGLGLDKNIGEDRKNISTLTKWFLETFSGNKDVGLVLKVGLVNNSLMDFEATKRRLQEIRSSVGCGPYPKIHLVHGRLSDLEMADLYRDPNVKAFVSITHGEGFGLPLLEAAACGLPVIATNWSGHLDFLTVEGKKKFVPIEYDLKEIPASAHWKGVMEPGSQWAYPREEDVKNKLKKVFLSYDKPKEWASELAQSIRDSHSLERVCYNLFRSIAEFANANGRPKTEDDMAQQIKSQLDMEAGKPSLLYTMPMSAGDVYISTAVVDSLKKKFPDHQIYFATNEKYASILKDNPDLFKVIRFENWMMNVPLLEKIFTQVYTPNLAIQTIHANWVRGGKGRRLAEEIAFQCGVELGEYKISCDPVDQKMSRDYIVFQPGSGKGQWEARNYLQWQEVVSNLKRLTGMDVVQVGIAEDPAYEGVIDLRGKTTYNQLAQLVKNSKLYVGIDTCGMHMAAGFGVQNVAIFGSSYANSTGPVPSTYSTLLETKDRYGCEKACYKYQCHVKSDNPCLNEVTPREITEACLKSLKIEMKDYKEYVPTISGYTHILNPDSHGFPFVESIRSMLGFCDEVIVVDGGSTDGSLMRINTEINDPRVKVMSHDWDWNEPAMDGIQKAFGRAMCSGQYLWQQDADEVVHEQDYQKIKNLVKKFPRDVDLLSLPVVELWGNEKTVRTDRHSWKWRLSRNDFKITHGINKNARVIDEKTGRTYAKKGMSDGCEYIDVMTGDYIPHRNFYTPEMELLRKRQPQEYGKVMNGIFEDMPCVFHYSWMDLGRKIRNFKSFWNKCWSNLYNEEKPVDRFPETSEDSLSIARTAEDLFNRGGEHGEAQTFSLNRSNPTLMKSWIERADRKDKNAGGHIHNNEEPSGLPEEISRVSEEQRIS